jgi:hypothetical protein
MDSRLDNGDKARRMRLECKTAWLDNRDRYMVDNCLVESLAMFRRLLGAAPSGLLPMESSCPNWPHRMWMNRWCWWNRLESTEVRESPLVWPVLFVTSAADANCHCMDGTRSAMHLYHAHQSHHMWIVRPYSVCYSPNSIVLLRRIATIAIQPLPIDDGSPNSGIAGEAMARR